MFMVQYDQAGVAGPHDHPFEETYLFLEGEAEAVFDGETYHLQAGDVAFAGVGCVHGFRNVGDGTRALAGNPGAATAGSALVPVRPGLGLPALGDGSVERGGTLRWQVRSSSSAARLGSAGTSRTITPAAVAAWC